MLTKVHLIKAMVFLVMYGCKGWTIKKAECRRRDAFKLWCWWRLLKVLWTARRSNKLILKEINPEYSLERLMLKLKLHYFGHLMWKADSLEKTPMLGKTEGKRRRQKQRVGWLDSLTDSTDMSLSKLQEIVKDGESGILQFIGQQLNAEQQKEKTYLWLIFTYFTCFHLFVISLHPIETYFTRITYLSKLLLSQQLQCSICFQ